MCQLFLFSINNSIYGKKFPIVPVILGRSLRIDSRIQHKDGCGFFSETSGLFKSQHAASLLTNLDFFTEKTSRTVMGHVRAASLVNGQKTIKREFSHPFEKTNFILMHNGFLKPKQGEIPQEITDSEFFADELDKEVNLNAGDSFYTSLVKTMEKFSGKFAFIIYHKLEKRFYIVRGSTAELHFCVVKSEDDQNLALVVNTTKESLLDIMFEVSNTLSFCESKYKTPTVSNEKSKIVEVEKETVFILDDISLELVNVGKIKESYPISSAIVTPQNANYGGYGTNYGGKYYADFDTLIGDLTGVMNFLGCDPYYLNNTVFPLLIGKPLVDSNYNDLSKFFAAFKKLEIYVRKNKTKPAKSARRLKSISETSDLVLAAKSQGIIPEYFLIRR